MERISNDMNFINLHKTAAFCERFEHNYTKEKTQREAYEKTEAEYNSVFGCNKYASFESFINTYYERERKKLKN